MGPGQSVRVLLSQHFLQAWLQASLYGGMFADGEQGTQSVMAVCIDWTLSVCLSVMLGTHWKTYTS